MNWPTGRRTRLVARTELRRTWRNLRDGTRGVLMLVVGLLLVPAYSLGIGALAFFGGGELSTVDPAQFRLATVAAIGGVVGTVVFVTLQRSVKKTGEPDSLDGLLTTISYEDVLAGVVAAELCRVLAVLSLPLLALAVGLAAGTGWVLVGALVLAMTLLAATLGTVLGYGGGLAVKLVAARSEFVARHRASLGMVTSLSVVLVWVGVSTVPSIQLSALRVVTASPLAWVADLLALTVPGITADPLPAAAAGIGLLGGVPLALLGTLWLAERVWYVDPVQPDHEFDPEDRPLADRLLDGRVPTATRVVVGKSWLRARRAPFTVQFAIAPLFVLVYQLQPIILESRIPATLPLTSGLAIAAAFGAAFTLNPLGGEENVLPLTLTASVSGRAFVGGLVLAGALPGVVVTTLLTGGVGLAGGTPLPALVAALVTALTATVAGPAIAAGAGIVFPKFESSSVQGHTVTVPSGWAFLLYFAVLGVAVAPASVAYVLAVTEFVPVPVETPLLLGVGVGLTLVLAAVTGAVSYRYAADRVATYRLD